MFLSSSDDDFVLGELCRRVEKKWNGTDRGLVVILGAGASVEYGLPSFHTLLKELSDVYDKYHERELDIKEPDVYTLRQRLDKFWLNCGSGELRRLLSRFLKIVDGRNCPGYLYLAQLAKQRKISAIINMNFDLLLLQACWKINLSPRISQSFCESDSHHQKSRGKNSDSVLRIITPNGSLHKRGGTPILDLAASNLFEKQKERNAARELLTRNHVLVIGYSGTDAKICNALSECLPDETETPTGVARESAAATLDVPKDQEDDQKRTERGEGKEENVPSDTGDKRLFVINLGGPGAHLKPIQKRRASENLYLRGSEASFSYFMEQFYMMATLGKEFWELERAEQENARSLYSGNCTLSERKALDACRNLALEIRSSLDVADWGARLIETHAEDLSLKVSELARCCAIPLTVAELFLVRSTSFFHDLGFFWARSRERKSEYPGLKVLKVHGEKGAKRLKKIIDAYDPDKGRSKKEIIIPAYYSEDSKKRMTEWIFDLCEYHSELEVNQQERADKNDEIKIDECTIPVRFNLVCALFTLAEEMIRGEPRTDSERLRVIMVDELIAAIDDPIIDLYWNEEGVKIEYRILGKGILEAKPSEPRGQSKVVDWLLSRVEKAVDNVNLAVSKSYQESRRPEVCRGTFRLVLKGPGKSDQCSDSSPERNERERIRYALHERMMKSIKDIGEQRDKSDKRIYDTTATVLDLLSIYILPRPKHLGADEPRAELGAGDFDGIFARFGISADDPDEASSKSVLCYYFSALCARARKARARKARGMEGENVMDDFFCRMFEERLYPTWRYLANLSNLSIDQIDVFPTLYNLGSSRYRPEFSFALKHLVRDKFESKGRFLYGHDGCMECTGRLLYALAVARERLCDRDLEVVVPDFGKCLNGIITFLLKGPDERDWFGLYREHGRDPHERIQQLSYFSWGISGMVRALSAERKVRMQTDDCSWIASLTEHTAEDLEDLTKAKWQDLCNMSGEELRNLSYESGGPAQSLMVLGLCCLDVQKKGREWKGWREYLLPDFLEEVTKDRWGPDCSIVDRYRLIPAALAVWTAKKDDNWVERLVETVVRCNRDPLWIRDGVSYGSWGYSGEVSNDVAASLVAFWRHAFEYKEVFSRAFEKLKSEKPDLFR